MSPVMREVCAFLSEGAILSYCSSENARLGEDLLKLWQKSNRRYFGTLARKLKESLKTSDAIYEYGWNYPLARFFALEISQSFSRDLMWRVFSGDYSVKRVLNQLAI